MTDQEIFTKISEMYNSEKGKGFITHLLRSFLPVYKSTKLFNNHRNLKLRDCITGEELSTVDEHFDVIGSEEGMNAFMDSLKSQIKQNIDDSASNETPESLQKLWSKLKPIAVTCEDSDKFVSEQTLRQLYNFFATEVLRGNKHLNWVLNNEKGKQYVSYGKRMGFVENKRDENVIKKAAERATLSLGDLDVLKNLKDKLDSKNQNL